MMSAKGFRRLRRALCACLLSLSPGTTVHASPAATKQWNFDVFLDERAIGYHRFELRPDEEGLRVDSEADFAVKALFFTAFRYQHENTEIWRGDCLQRISSRTDSNGRLFEVQGLDQGERFLLATRDGRTKLTDCVGSFAYWDRRLLERQRLLNSQTGEYVEVELAPLAAGTLRIGEREIAVERFTLKAPGMDILLAYAMDSGEWVALDSTVEGGRMLRYRREPSELVDTDPDESLQ